MGNKRQNYALERKLRITVVMGPFIPMPPAPCTGAVENLWHGLTTELAKRGNSVTVFSRAHSSVPAENIIDGIRNIRRLSMDRTGNIMRDLMKDFWYSKTIRHLLNEADILVTNTFFLPLLIGKTGKYGKLCVHVARLPKGQMRFYRNADRLQAVSSAVGNAIIEECPNMASKVIILPNFLSNCWFEHPDILYTPKQKVVLYAGRIHPEKGIELALDAFSIFQNNGHPDWRMIIAGPYEAAQGGGGSDYFKALNSKLSNTGNSIEWLGPVYDMSSVRALYDKSSMFLYPSLAEKGESFGMSPLEAMSRGCVPIVSKLECFSQYLNNGINGVSFDHRNTCPQTELARAMSKLADNDSYLNKLSIAGVETALSFSIDKAADMYLDDFHQLLNI